MPGTNTFNSFLSFTKSPFVSNTHKNTFLYKLTLKMTSTNDLSASLLGNIPQHECDEHNAEYDEEEGCLTCFICDDNVELRDWKSDSMFFTFALHVLLFVQFGMAFSTFPVEAMTGLSWSAVNYIIILYAITTIIYRQAAKDCKSTCSTVILLPEICIDIMLVLVLFNKVVIALLFLQFSMLCLALLVVAKSIWVLMVTKYDTDESESDDDLQPQDDLDVSYFKGGRIRTM
jgi:hypothetical protein